MQINGNDNNYFYEWLEHGFFNETIPLLEKRYITIGGVRISQKRLIPHKITQLDGKKTDVFLCKSIFGLQFVDQCNNEDNKKFFGKDFVFNKTNVTSKLVDFFLHCFFFNFLT